MTETVDVVLIGGGIMSATLGTFLRELEPDWTIAAFERAGELGSESSNPWNNAGTGHAALCELNYMPDPRDPAKAISINEQFQQSRQLWTSLFFRGILDNPGTFIHSVPHMTFVRGQNDYDYLKQRFETLKQQPLFSGMEFSDDSRVINRWAPLLMQRRKKSDEPFAATFDDSGTDVDFGAITHQLFGHLEKGGVDLRLSTEVTDLTKQSDGTWLVKFRNNIGRTPGQIKARFVFIGAGGWAIKLLQKANVREVSGYGVFPIGGQFLRTTEPSIVARHRAKVYSQAAVGAPPMSVPHLDARVVDDEESVMFGPYATFSPKFLKNGSLWDIVGQVRPSNLGSMLKVGATNVGLVRYLVRELMKNRAAKVESLQAFVPAATGDDWELINAGQRAQVMKGGKLQFGTEVVQAADGSIAGLLGASPGASTTPSIMLNVLKGCFPDRFEAWTPTIRELIPTYGQKLNDDAALAEETMERTAAALNLTR